MSEKSKSNIKHPRIYIFKKDLEGLSYKQLRGICKNRIDLFKGYSHHLSKKSLLSYMNENFKTSKIQLKLPPFIDVKLEEEMTDTLKSLGKNYTEYSIGVDFQKITYSDEDYVASNKFFSSKVKDIEPQKVFLMKGERYQTIKLEGYDLFGHTHPTETYPYPSASDIATMRIYKPEFIIGKTGNMIITNIENVERFLKWLKKNEHKGINDTPLSLHELKIDTSSIRDKKGNILKKYEEYLLRDEKGRDVFFRETGVRVIPYRKGMKFKINKKGNIKII